MAKKRRPAFIEHELIGDRLIEETILDVAVPEDIPIERFRDHPERERPGEHTGKGSRVRRPPRNDPRHADQSVLPGRPDIPAGSERPAPAGSS